MASPRPNALARVDRVLAPLTWLAAAFAVLVLLAGPELIGADKPGGGGAAAPAGAAPSGQALFTSSGCAGCHTLADADASGTAGPDLDQLAPDAATVATAVKTGPGAMPGFEGQLSGAEIQAVADYVARSAGG
jgi:mono/diheme cytochrome c family protein